MSTDLHSKQLELEATYAKNNLIPRLRHYYENHPDHDFVDLAKKAGISSKFMIDTLVQIAIHKRVGVSTLVPILRHHADNMNDIAMGLDYLVALGVLNFNEDLDIFIVVFDIPREIQAELDTFQYPLPMVVKPPKLVNNRSLGYLSISGSIILKNNHHDGDICLDHFNRVNSVPFVINKVTAVMVQNKWKGLDKISPDETVAEFQAKQKTFSKYKRTCEQVFDEVTPNNEPFWLTHRPDKRGRTYCQGYHVNYQGNDWCKAVIEFADKEIIPLD